MKTVNERIKIILKNESCSVRSIAKGDDVLSRKISRQIRGDSALTSDVLKLFIESFPEYNPMWIMFGDGEQKESAEIVRKYKTEFSVNNVYDASLFNCGQIGAVSETITKGFMNGYISLPEAPNDVFYVKAKGDSMTTIDYLNSIPDGAYVALRKTKATFIRWGEIYGISTSDGFIIKKVMPSEDEGKIKCISLNEEKYPPFEIPKIEVNDMALVVGVVYSFFRN